MDVPGAGMRALHVIIRIRKSWADHEREEETAVIYKREATVAMMTAYCPMTE